MDNYPDHLTPKKWESWDKEPFPDWWKRVRDNFPTIPENVAEQWLYRHWKSSPYYWLPSTKLRFELKKWDNQRIEGLISNDDLGRISALERGAYLCSLNDPGKHTECWPAKFIAENGTWPEPIIVLYKPNVVRGDKFDELPSGYFVVEGHLRFASMRHLITQGAVADEHSVWLMTIDDRK